MSAMSNLADVDDNSSDTHDVQYVDHPAGIVEHVEVDDQVSPKKTQSPATTATTAEPMSDAVSVQSAPAIRMSHNDQSSSTPPPSALPPPSPSRSTHRDGVDDRARLSRRRSIAEPRTSKRLSGFFNNLIHRRDAPVRNNTRDEQPAASSSSQQQDKPDSSDPSRSSSPSPLTLPPPPPKLPPPTLQELGLSLSVVTPDLSPAHFSTPPSSGAFLSPHYLLLCHAQGLDVLPLVSPPEPQPYALIRRVSFKSIVVMEHRGVLVAIAGRREGVRVYALEEIRKAVEWRMDVEIRREKDRMRRELAKKVSSGVPLDARDSSEKLRKPSSSTPPPSDSNSRAAILRKGSFGHVPPPIQTIQTPQAPLIPRMPTTRRPKAPQATEPSGRPPPYSAPEHTSPQQMLRSRNSTISLTPVRTRSRGGSVSDVLNAPSISRVNTEVVRPRDPDSKEDWVESSDDEAINVVAAASSGSQALDERTSATHAPSFSQSTNSAHTLSGAVSHNSSPAISRRNRPANLDLSLTHSNTSVAPPEPSPAPTLLTLRQALSHSPPRLRDLANQDTAPDPDTPLGDGDEDEDVAGVNGQISLTQALLESRLPDLPPPGTRRAQQPILISASHPVATGDDEPSSPRTSDAQSAMSFTTEGSHLTPTAANGSNNRRRRWSLMLSQPSSSPPPSGSIPTSHSASSITPMRERTPARLMHSTSRRSDQSPLPRRPSSAGAEPGLPSRPVPPLPENAAMISSASAVPSLNSAASVSSSSRSRFLPKIISNAINNIRSDNDRPSTAGGSDADGAKKMNGSPIVAHVPPPKLEYVKLPGTKGSLMIKSVETAKKSFLAILCGDNGEKVELFAGTYRTALGLSRTFILPDSPRSLELQLQGDDLVEVFLVFSQNVFGLEPATVRVREVRIGRAERRAARRRAREARTGEGTAPTNDSEAQLPADEDTTNVNVSIGVSVAVGATVVASGPGPVGPQTPPFVANQHPEQERGAPSPAAPTTSIGTIPENNSEGPASASAVAQAEELVALATAQMGPYTTFQQLSFAPRFPLASIADDYVIPPTYADFIEYRTEHEPAEGGGSVDLAQVNFSPPGLPVPTPSAPSKWFYRDPKGVVHGPWKASLMQAWYKDGLLPPDLPVRKEEDSEYMLLKDLRLQSVDPTHPFKAARTSSNTPPANVFQPSDKPLLKPISLLSQPRHFGPPALFFSSRGGHSTAIVDARGRSVLKGRFVWSEDDRHDDDSKPVSLMGRMGDVKRLEAVDIKDRSVLIAMRQGGVEAVDLSDALLRPADESRTMLPQFSPAVSSISRRAPFVWKIGTPVSSSPTSATVLSARPKTGHSHMANLAKNKLSTGSAKSPGSRTEFNIGDADTEYHDEVLFLGRKDDEIYICERNAGSFRILRISPDIS